MAMEIVQFRDCLEVCKKLWPYAIVKLHED